MLIDKNATEKKTGIQKQYSYRLMILVYAP